MYAHTLYIHIINIDNIFIYSHIHYTCMYLVNKNNLRLIYTKETKDFTMSLINIVNLPQPYSPPPIVTPPSSPPLGGAVITITLASRLYHLANGYYRHHAAWF